MLLKHAHKVTSMEYPREWSLCPDIILKGQQDLQVREHRLLVILRHSWGSH